MMWNTFVVKSVHLWWRWSFFLKSQSSKKNEETDTEGWLWQLWRRMLHKLKIILSPTHIIISKTINSCSCRQHYSPLFSLSFFNKRNMSCFSLLHLFFFCATGGWTPPGRVQMRCALLHRRKEANKSETAPPLVNARTSQRQREPRRAHANELCTGICHQTRCEHGDRIRSYNQEKITLVQTWNFYRLLPLPCSSL